METKLGIIAFFFLAGSFIECSESSSPLKKDSFVMDQEQLLTPRQKDSLNALYYAHEKKTSNEIVLVTAADYGNDSTILFYSTRMGNQLGVGKKDKDNGIVIVVSKANRETRIATGYGTEKVLQDQLAKKIIDSLMIPEFKKGNFYEGIYAGSTAIINFLEHPAHEIH